MTDRYPARPVIKFITTAEMIERFGHLQHHAGFPVPEAICMLPVYRLDALEDFAQTVAAKAQADWAEWGRA